MAAQVTVAASNPNWSTYANGSAPYPGRNGLAEAQVVPHEFFTMKNPPPGAVASGW